MRLAAKWISLTAANFMITAAGAGARGRVPGQGQGVREEMRVAKAMMLSA
ncbi:hypothetical protein GA0070608_6273 [Micromonospora peucetia]|uniref:Uncharacterized protein n=1 Tax=Micromonospora peucetia TaxID=47871 RepID=A0A1C6W5Z8_9ACTN|nr:hypothetical protein GA0070608_6273 [Micromonospora peucetia]